MFSNLLPLLRGGGANLKTSEKDLVTVLPHDEDGHGADQRLDQVQYDLDQEVEGERSCYDLTVADFLVGEDAGYWVILLQFALTVLFHLHAAQAASLWVVVSSKHHDQHWYDQAHCAQDEVEELQGEEGDLEALGKPVIFKLFCFYTGNLAAASLCCLMINLESQNYSLETDTLARGRCQVKEITHNSRGRGLALRIGAQLLAQMRHSTCKTGLQLQPPPTHSEHPVWARTTENV